MMEAAGYNSSTSDYLYLNNNNMNDNYVDNNGDAGPVLAVLWNVVVCTVVGVAGGLGFGVLHVSMEGVWFRLLRWLEGKGLVQRLAPAIPLTKTSPNIEDFLSVSIAPMPLAAIMCSGRSGYWARCKWEADVVGGLEFTWALMVAHDLYFWAVHTQLHRAKALFRRVHQLHHTTGGDLSVYSTAYGEVMDIALCFTPFYSAVMLLLFRAPAWNPFHIILATYAVNNVDMMGHCGYRLPAWLWGPASLGVLFTPGSQRPIHHYIHHLDARYNRSLYFTWCDRLAGTYKDRHPKVTNY